MSKFVFFGSTAKMTARAKEYILDNGRKNTDVVSISSSEAWKATQLAKDLKAKIIIARGTIAAELKRSTDLPVVEVVITAQEMGLLIKRAIKVIKKTKPVIAIVGVAKMFCDMRDFDEIFDIRLKTFFVSSANELEAGVIDAINHDVDLIIGGEIVCAHASAYNVPSMRQPDGSDSIEQAFRIADSIAWVAEMEKKNAVELKALLDFSSNGIIKIDKQGAVVAFNNQMLALLDKAEDEIEGKNITSIIPSLDAAQIFNNVLEKGMESFLTFWHTTGSALAVNAVPLLVDSAIQGAILSFHEIHKLKQLEAEARRDLIQNTQIKKKYDWLLSIYSENISFLQEARNIAQFDECVLLSGSHSAERELIARYMHDVSLRQNALFEYIPSANYNSKFTDHIFLSEDDPVLLSADSGTVFIDDVDKLSLQAQYNLYRLLTNETLIKDISKTTHNFRIIIGTQADLNAAVQNGMFREDLYFMISALTLELPPLEGCSNEIINWITYYLNQFSQMYSLCVHITKAARNAIMTHPWKGGIAELRSFCCKAIFNTPKQVLDESTALRFLRQNNPYEAEDNRKKTDLNGNPEVTRLKFLMEKYDGNRSMIAEEMHISNTTLWRRLKKYNLI